MEATVGPTMAMVAELAGRFSELTNAAEDDARRTAVALAKQLMEFFAVQGWIAQDMTE